MADLRNPLLVFTRGAAGRQSAPVSGPVAPVSANVLQATAKFYGVRRVYPRPSEQPAVAIFREQAVNVQGYYVAPPDRGEFQRRQIIWRGVPTARAFRAPLGSTVAEQTHRTFGGRSQPFYQALAAPSIADVAKHMGGIRNA